MKLFQYGFKLYYRSTHGDDYEETQNLFSYLDQSPSLYPYAQDCGLYWNGHQIGYISNGISAIVIKLGETSFIFTESQFKNKVLRDLMVYCIPLARNLKSSGEILELIRGK